MIPQNLSQPVQRRLELSRWLLMRLAFRRTGFQALKRLCVSMYYTDKVSWDAIGYSGMFLPEDRS